MLLGAAAALQAPCGQHLPGEPSRWAGQVQHGEAHLLLAVQPREIGPYRRVPLPEGQPGYLQEEKWVSSDCLFIYMGSIIHLRLLIYGTDCSQIVCNLYIYIFMKCRTLKIN